MSKSVIFVYFKPASPAISLEKVETLCSEYGPIKSTTSSIEHSNETNYNKGDYYNSPRNNVKQQNFNGTNHRISFLNEEDAQEAIVQLSDKTVEENSTSYKLKAITQQQMLKLKFNRLIIRNVSFYAKEHDIQKTLQEKFGPIWDLHLPAVPNSSNQKNKSLVTHRGFAFAVFDKLEDAHKAVKEKKVVIKGRECKLEFSENRTDYQKRVSEQKLEAAHADINENEHKVETEDSNKEESHKEDSSSESDEESSHVSDDESSKDSDSSDTDTSSKEDEDLSHEEDKEVKKEPTKKKDLPSNEKAIFLHNLPFDAERDEIQDLFSSYGPIQSIYLTKNPNNASQNKGSAFLYFKTVATAKTVLSLFAKANNNNQVDLDSANALMLHGRPIQVSAPFLNEISHNPKSSITQVKKKKENIKSDKRHLYLRIPSIPSRPGDDDVNIPGTDKRKRVQSKKERNLKLRSPLFFINPTRLSIRNLSKNIDNIKLKDLLATSLTHALNHDMVTQTDVTMHFHALGYTDNEIRTNKECTIPAFNPKNTNEFIPSVYIMREEDHTSKGFAFVDFKYHVHALAVLRQIDNNIQYSREYAMGGDRAARRVHKRKKNDEKNAGFPRLIVEFAVENKAKQMKSLERREYIKQEQLKQKEKNLTHKQLRRRARGKRQRENKRKGEDNRSSTEQEVHEPQDKIEEPTVAKEEVVQKKIKRSKKKQKLDQEDVNFESMVSSYKKKLFAFEDNDQAFQPKKRWFEES